MRRKRLRGRRHSCHPQATSGVAQPRSFRLRCHVSAAPSFGDSIPAHHGKLGRRQALVLLIHVTNASLLPLPLCLQASMSMLPSLSPLRRGRTRAPSRAPRLSLPRTPMRAITPCTAGRRFQETLTRCGGGCRLATFAFPCPRLVVYPRRHLALRNAPMTCLTILIWRTDLLRWRRQHPRLLP